jgi:hypothetical protein
MIAALKVLILGGYGTFGGRLAQLLADDERLMLMIAGRSRTSADAFCKGLRAKASLIPLAFDRDGDVQVALRDAAPNIVVDASGPFQNYSGDPYHVIRACLALGINYLDLADGSDFVSGIAQFDREAEARGIFILSGVSSFPVLTAAVVRALSSGMARVDSVAGGIAPSPYAGVGLNVIRAIASYAGRRIDLPQGPRAALIDARRFTIAPPGYLPLDPVRFSLVDVPDLKALPALWPSLRSVWMGAGPVPGILHRALSALARFVRWRIVPSLSPFALLMYRAINVLRFGEHRGGMFVAVTGVSGRGETLQRSWHLVAEGDDGPLIPSMACEAIVRNVLAGRAPLSGARAATNDLELADYEKLFAARAIFTGTRTEQPEAAPLYRRVLGDAYERMPAPLQQLHDLNAVMTAEGLAQVERGRSVVARFVATVMGFPQEGKDVPVRVRFRREGARERWQRTFGSRTFSSTQEEGLGRFDRLLCERFGPFAFGLALIINNERLALVVRRWSVFGLPLPRALAPRGDAYEHGADERFNFHVEIALPVVGRIVRYRGWLKPVSEQGVV